MFLFLMQLRAKWLKMKTVSRSWIGIYLSIPNSSTLTFVSTKLTISQLKKLSLFLLLHQMTSRWLWVGMHFLMKQLRQSKKQFSKCINSALRIKDLVSQVLKFTKQSISPKEELLSDFKRKKLLSEETYSYD